MKRRTFILAGTVIAATLASAMLPMRRALVWNATASVPTGLYAVGSASALARGERVVMDPPARLRKYLAIRGYLPVGIPLVKEIAALGGDNVCRAGPAITINGITAGMARANDRQGRALPRWEGCRTLAANELFVMNPRSADSFDSRYFGPVERASVIGRAIPVWTDEGPANVPVWFAFPLRFRVPNGNQGDLP